MFNAARYWTFLIVFSPLQVIAGADGPFGSYHALVIGNNNYHHLENLQTAANDARSVGKLLNERYGFQVTELIDADKTVILRALNRLKSKLEVNDNLLIYFAGHGTIEKPHNIGFWLPVDAEPEDDTNWLANTEVTRRFLGMAAKHVLVVADSCYSGSLLRDGAPSENVSEDTREEWLLRIASQRARMALTSGSLEPVQDGGGGEHSVFAQAFLEILSTNREIIDGQSLFLQLREKVMVGAEQTPLYSTLRKAGHEGGDFIFRPLTVAIPTVEKIKAVDNARVPPKTPAFLTAMTGAASKKFSAFGPEEFTGTILPVSWHGHGWSDFMRNDPSDPAGFCSDFNVQFVVNNRKVMAKLWNRSFSENLVGEINFKGKLLFPPAPDTGVPVITGTLSEGRWTMLQCQGDYRMSANIAADEIPQAQTVNPQ